jgi:hypothetical protein
LPHLPSQANIEAGALVQLPADEAPAPHLTGGGAGDTLSSLVLTHYSSSLTASPVITSHSSAAGIASSTGAVHLVNSSRTAVPGLGGTTGTGGDVGSTDVHHHQLGTFAGPFKVKDLAQLRGLDFAWQVCAYSFLLAHSF